MKRKILKYTAIFIGGIILALAVAPFIFKDEIFKEIKKICQRKSKRHG
ncbi:MAG: hypothetical protein IPN29_13130 [Saprospiraceae bacterium]|nr:hypothetical protein [Saprospiraceae bacterium]